MAFSFGRPKVFKSLNCATCDSPFSPTTNDPKSPRNLDCGLSICKECFEDEKGNKGKGKKHSCKSTTNCFNNPNPAYFMLELFSTNCLTLSPSQNGYLLADNFPDIECNVCQEKFILEDRRPIQLYCNHAVCFRCVQNLRIETGKTKYPFLIICPICRSAADYDDNQNSQYIEFMRELPIMREQLEFMRRTGQRLCPDCGRNAGLDDVFRCGNCKTLCCGSCGIRNHKNHEFKDFSNEEIDRNTEDLIKAINQLTQIDEEFGRKILLINEITTDISRFQELLLGKLFSIQQMTLPGATRELQGANDLKKSFEEIVSDFYAQNEATNGKLKNILKVLESENAQLPAQPSN